MALSSIQDISTIQTPPPGRKPIITEVVKMDWNKIIEAITFERKRKGQVYFVYNSVSKIYSIAAQLKKLTPDIKVAVAHGQMNPDQLDKIMTDFVERKYDCLISTTIIENGIDLKNVNTMIVIKSQNFGLSQLYQLRGRIGRSERQAYAYFFYDGSDLDTEQISASEDVLETKEYIKRLKALKEADELGAGFDIATKDLEIRGAGNLLGREQHGNINKIGFGLYMQMLAQEIERLKAGN
jgi:transcription-repair coupling factor (superfamily II helicase)